MSASLSDTTVEPRWLTYAKGIVFTSPAVVAWGFACIFLLPKAREICHNASLDPAGFGWLWGATLLLAQWGRSMLVVGVLMFVLLEFAAPKRGRGRGLAVGISVWLANVAVLFGLTMLLIVVLVAAPRLAHPQ
jgi:hypothetical protein